MAHHRYTDIRITHHRPDTDDEGWEDDDTTLDDSNATGRSPRRYRKAIRVNGRRKRTPFSKQNPDPDPERQPNATRNAMVEGALNGAIFAGRYLLDAFRNAIYLLCWPISIFLCLWFLSLMIPRTSQMVQQLFQPLCILPGASKFTMCKVNNDPNNNTLTFVPQWADYPKLVEVQSKTFEHLLQRPVGGSAMSLELKKAEMATSDLITRIRISDLKAKNMLAESLGEFLKDARKMGRGLQKLTSKVNGAVDSIMAMNDYALQSIESARANEPSRWSPRALAIWKPARPSTNAVITKTFEEAMSVLSTNMEKLILEAERNLHNLNALEEKLATLHEAVCREDSSITTAKNELLGELWTIVGGNRKELLNFEQHLNLLKGLSVYRSQALAHVVAALKTLQAMSNDMEDMRERVAAPDLVGSSVPVEVHMKSIRMGLDRLREGKTKAKHLEEEAVKRVFPMGY